MAAERIFEFGSTMTPDPMVSITSFAGVKVLISNGSAGDYLAMRAAHLAALMKIMALEGFELQSVDTKNNIRWLAATLAEEVNQVVPYALKEAERE